MKVLWLVNIGLPEVMNLMKIKKSRPFGGWLINSSKKLSEENNIKLTLVFPDNKVKNIEKYKGEKITYYAFRKSNKENFKKILEEVKPDIVHIHGTEFSHSLDMLKACEEKNIKKVTSIQGLVSVISRHMTANLPIRVIYGMTLRNFLFRDSVTGLIKNFKKRGVSEIQVIKQSTDIIGRTSWDYACVKQLNDNLNYHFCNESLREEFYNHRWEIEKMEKYSIFLSQGQYSIKGLHYVIEAMPIIIKNYPNARLYVGGKNIILKTSIKDRLLITYYGKYIKELIKKYKLEKNVIFVGELDEIAMCQRYLKSNVFVCPSTIENSPNSLAEAMILGVPSIATNVGGILDMLDHKKDGLIYQTDAPYMLAHHICEIFENPDLANFLSKNARKKALDAHDIQKNTKKLLEIYTKILK